MLPPMEAAFFDLDKTVIAKASMVAFGRPLYRQGLISRRLLVRALYGQLVYMHLGANEAKLERMRQSVLALTKGWEQARVSSIVREALTDVVEPIIYDEALELIEEHRAAGRKVFIVSASPEEIVAPLGEFLGVDAAIATRAASRTAATRGRWSSTRTGRTRPWPCAGSRPRRTSTSCAPGRTPTRPPTSRCSRRWVTRSR